MSRATDAARDPSQIVCLCGDDCRGRDTCQCPVSETFSYMLSTGIEDFENIQKVFEFGKDGPMAHCLGSVILSKYKMIHNLWESLTAISDQHAECHSVQDFLWSWFIFRNLEGAQGCAEDMETLGSHPPPSVLPDIVGDEEETLRYAKDYLRWFYKHCAGVISEFVTGGAHSLSHVDDDEGYLTKIDNGFKEVFEAITCLPRTENANIQDLTDKSYEIWKECRRLLLDFRRS